jgi:hypothetical protein
MMATIKRKSDAAGDRVARMRLHFSLIDTSIACSTRWSSRLTLSANPPFPSTNATTALGHLLFDQAAHLQNVDVLLEIPVKRCGKCAVPTM